jgi:hypothetical protein
MVDSNTSKSEDLRRIVMRWMMVSLLSGLVLARSGFYLLTFTNITIQSTRTSLRSAGV